MSGITDYLNPNLKAKHSRVSRFNKAADGKSKAEQRRLERALLKPAPLPDYTGEAPTNVGIDARSVKLVFSSDKDYALFTKHFRVCNYVETCCYRLDMLTAFLKALDKGRLKYDSETGRIKSTKRRDHTRGDVVGTEKQRRSVRRRGISIPTHQQ
jgi:hypothetical protein